MWNNRKPWRLPPEEERRLLAALDTIAAADGYQLACIVSVYQGRPQQLVAVEALRALASHIETLGREDLQETDTLQ